MIGDDVSVNNGRVVETGSVTTVFSSPQQPYTVELLKAIPGSSLVPASASPAHLDTFPHRLQ